MVDRLGSGVRSGSVCPFPFSGSYVAQTSKFGLSKEGSPPSEKKEDTGPSPAVRIETEKGCPFSFQILSEIRHLIMDLGYGFDLKVTKITGLIVIIGSIVLTVVFYLIGKNFF